VADLPGRPDIALPRHRAAVEVQGCFWHRHEQCEFCTTPASNKRFWKSKFGKTVKRDKRNLETLRKLGWKVAIVWECSIKDEGAEAVAGKIAAWLQSGRSFKEISSRTAKAASRRISEKKT
jgi:DNA mismatch endonuclease (patch repair protein)